MSHSTSLFIDLTSLLSKLTNHVILSEKDKLEINEVITNAIKLTEDFFYLKGNRNIERNVAIADAWINAGKVLQNILPKENIGIWLHNKGEAYLNPNKWTEQELVENKLQIEEIKKQKTELLKRKFK